MAGWRLTYDSLMEGVCVRPFSSASIGSVEPLLTHERKCPILVLARKKNEEIVIGDNITIMVVEIRGDKIRLGFSAPPEVPIHRKEIYDQIKQQEAGE